MSSLKELRNRQRSVRSTRKITSAMKMISVAKLKRAQIKAEQVRDYANLMHSVLLKLADSSNTSSPNNLPALLMGTGSFNVHLIVLVTSSRGLCGGFNSSVVKSAMLLAKRHLSEGGQVQFICVGQKGADQLKTKYGNLIKKIIVVKPTFSFFDASIISSELQNMLDSKFFDICTIVYSKFISALTQEVTTQQLIPFSIESSTKNPDSFIEKDAESKNSSSSDSFNGVLEYEPDQKSVLSSLLPRNLNIQIYRAVLENLASEHGARMTAMDSATRNADDMIKKLQLKYNRTRQAYITKELLEIISGAEAI